MYSYDSANTQKIKFRFQTNDHNLGYSCYSPLLTTVLTENRKHIPHDFEIGFARQSNHHNTDTVTKPSQIRHHLIRRRETTLLRRLRHSQWLRQATQSLHKPEKEVSKREYTCTCDNSNNNNLDDTNIDVCHGLLPPSPSREVHLEHTRSVTTIASDVSRHANKHSTPAWSHT